MPGIAFFHVIILTMKKCAIFLAKGFEECEALITVDVLRRAGLTIDMISMEEECQVESSHGVFIVADKLWKEIDVVMYDALILPGGMPGTKHLGENEELTEALLSANAEGKCLCAICAAPSIFGKLGILEGKKYTCFPGFEGDYGAKHLEDKVVKDGSIITAKGMGATIEFASCIVETLVNKEKAEEIIRGIQYH